MRSLSLLWQSHVPSGPVRNVDWLADVPITGLDVSSSWSSSEVTPASWMAIRHWTILRAFVTYVFTLFVSLAASRLMARFNLSVENNLKRSFNLFSSSSSSVM